MPTPFTTYAFPLSAVQPNATATRTDPTRWTDVLNVKDYGALGDGVTDDSSAIQTCLNDAYSNVSSYQYNKAVFFPNGHYIISKPVYIQNTWGAHVFGAGRQTTRIHNTGTTAASSYTGYVTPLGNAGLLTVLSTGSGAGQLNRGAILSGGGLSSGTPVGEWGTGTGGTGTYIISAQGTIGSSGAPISFTATNDTAVYLNGVGYSAFEDIQVTGATNGVGLDYDWTQEGTSSDRAGQLNQFSNIFFEGYLGCRVGFGNQCDTSTWINCYFQSSGAGLMVCNQNSLAHNVYGGNFQSCGIAIYCTGGSVNAIVGAGFQQSTTCDIKLQGGAGLCTIISGIDSESPNFASINGSEGSVHFAACGHRGNATQDNGFFLDGQNGTPVTIENCWSKRGNILKTFPLDVKNSAFMRQDALDSYSAGNLQWMTLENTYIGDPIDCIAHFYERRRIGTGGVVRQYDIEAASTSDTNMLYDSRVQSAGTISGVCTFTNAAPTQIAYGSGATAGMAAGTAVAFTNSGGGLPTGIVTNATYFVSSNGLTTTAFNISRSSVAGSSKVDTTSSGTGTQSIYLVRRYSVGDQILNNTVAASSIPGWVCTTAGYALPAVGGGSGMTIRALAACS